MNKEIKNLITSVNNKYSESSVRNLTREMDETLEGIRNHAKIITEMLMEKEKALIKGADLIRQENRDGNGAGKSLSVNGHTWR